MPVLLKALCLLQTSIVVVRHLFVSFGPSRIAQVDPLFRLGCELLRNEKKGNPIDNGISAGAIFTEQDKLRRTHRWRISISARVK